MGNCLFCRKQASKKKKLMESIGPHSGFVKIGSSKPDTIIMSTSLSFFSFIESSLKEDMLKLAERVLQEHSQMKMDNCVDFPVGNDFHRKSRLKFEKSPEGYNIQYYEIHDIFSVSSELALYFDINAPAIDTNLEFNKNLHFETTGDSIILLNHSRTKKMMMVQPRDYISIRVISRLSKNHFIDITQSVEVLGFEDQPEVSSYVQQAGENLCSAYYIAIEWKGNQSLCVKHSAVKTDPKSSVGLTIFKTFAASHFKKMAQLTHPAVLAFYKEGGVAEGMKSGDIIWFKGERGSFQESIRLSAKAKSETGQMTLMERAKAEILGVGL